MTMQTVEKEPVQSNLAQGEAEPNPGRVVSLSELVDFYYPDGMPLDKIQIGNVIRDVHFILLPHDIKYRVSSDPFLPILKGSTRKENNISDLQDSSDQFVWHSIEEQGLKLNIILPSSSDVHNIETHILGQLRDHLEPAEPTDLGLFQEHTHVYRMNSENGRFAITIKNKDSTETLTTPFIIVQKHMTALGDDYFTLKLAVDTNLDVPPELAFSKYRTLFEMRFSDSDRLPPLYDTPLINWDREKVEWINTAKEEPHAIVSAEVLKACSDPLRVELGDFARLTDPRDYVYLLLIAARMAHLATISGTDLEKVTLLKQMDFCSFKQAFLQLLQRGEDFGQEIRDFVAMMAYSSWFDYDLWLSNLNAVGIDELLPPSDQQNTSLPLVRLYSSFNPLIHPVRPENQSTRVELQKYAKVMRFCLALSEENQNQGNRALACIVLKDGQWITLRYDSIATDSNPRSHHIIKALEAAAESLSDPSLNGCDIITTCKPDKTGQIAIRMHPGIGKVIWSIPNPYINEDMEPDIITSALYGPPPQVIEGLLKPEAEAFYHTHPVNYHHIATTNYADALRTLNAQHGSMEHRIISELLGNSLAGKAVLDAGCGIGDEVALFRSKGADACGIDISPEFIKLAKQTHPDLTDRFLEARAESLPFPNASFDIILSKYVLNEIDNDRIEDIYREFNRCLKPGGKLLLFIHDPVSQMFSTDSETGEVLLDLFKQGKVNVRVFNNVVVFEPRHTYTDYLASLVRNFRLIHFDQGQDEQRIHSDKNIPEMLVLMAEKLEDR